MPFFERIRLKRLPFRPEIGRRRRGAVPQSADDEREARIAVGEQHQHLVVHIRHEERAAVLARERRDHAGPERGVLIGDGVERNQPHLDAVQAFRIVEADDSGEIAGVEPGREDDRRPELARSARCSVAMAVNLR